MNSQQSKPPLDEPNDPAQLWRYSDAVHRLHHTLLLSAEEEEAGKVATAEYERIQAFIAGQSAEIARYSKAIGEVKELWRYGDCPELGDAQKYIRALFADLDAALRGEELV